MKENDIVIIDYGMGNLLSVFRAFKLFTNDVQLSSNPSTILSAKKIVLPGVGAFGKAVEELKNRKIFKAIQEYAKCNKPLLGICLGMQLLYEKSYEFGEHEGLGIFPGEVVSLEKKKNNKDFKIPHIGWSRLELSKNKISDFLNLQNLIKSNDYFYFVHSYVGCPKEDSFLIASAIYDDIKIPSIVGFGNILGCQFHPEKSGKSGLNIIRQFCEN